MVTIQERYERDLVHDLSHLLDARTKRSGKPHARKALARIDALIEKEQRRHTRQVRTLKTRRAAAARSVTYYERKGAAPAKSKARRSPFPKSADVLKALRGSFPGLRTVDVGLRYDATGCVTADSRTWSDDSDLHEFEALAGLLAKLRAGEDYPDGVVADLYVYGEEYLMGNVDLTVEAGGKWTI